MSDTQQITTPRSICNEYAKWAKRLTACECGLKFFSVDGEEWCQDCKDMFEQEEIEIVRAAIQACCDFCGKEVYGHDMTSVGDSDLCEDCYCNEVDGASHET